MMRHAWAAGAAQQMARHNPIFMISLLTTRIIVQSQWSKNHPRNSNSVTPRSSFFSLSLSSSSSFGLSSPYPKPSPPLRCSELWLLRRVAGAAVGRRGTRGWWAATNGRGGVGRRGSRRAAAFIKRTGGGRHGHDGVPVLFKLLRHEIGSRAHTCNEDAARRMARHGLLA
jgi:hypothetical protein